MKSPSFGTISIPSERHAHAQPALRALTLWLAPAPARRDAISGKYPAAAFEERLALVSQTDTARVAMKQTHAQPLLQPGNALSDRRGGQPQLLAGVGKAASLRRTDKDVERGETVQAKALGRKRLLRLPSLREQVPDVRDSGGYMGRASPVVMCSFVGGAPDGRRDRCRRCTGGSAHMRLAGHCYPPCTRQGRRQKAGLILGFMRPLGSGASVSTTRPDRLDRPD